MDALDQIAHEMNTITITKLTVQMMLKQRYAIINTYIVVLYTGVLTDNSACVFYVCGSEMQLQEHLSKTPLSL